MKVEDILGECTCDSSYTTRELVDPSCIYCFASDEASELIQERDSLQRENHRYKKALEEIVAAYRGHENRWDKLRDAILDGEKALEGETSLQAKEE